METICNCEFGYELQLVIPYAYYLHENNLLNKTTSCSMTKEDTGSDVLTFPAASVTTIVQPEYAPTASVENMIVFVPAIAVVVALEQAPP